MSKILFCASRFISRFILVRRDTCITECRAAGRGVLAHQIESFAYMDDSAGASPLENIRTLSNVIPLSPFCNFS